MRKIVWGRLLNKLDETLMEGVCSNLSQDNDWNSSLFLSGQTAGLREVVAVKSVQQQGPREPKGALLSRPRGSGPLKATGKWIRKPAKILIANPTSLF